MYCADDSGFDIDMPDFTPYILIVGDYLMALLGTSEYTFMALYDLSDKSPRSTIRQLALFIMSDEFEFADVLSLNNPNNPNKPGSANISNLGLFGGKNKRRNALLVTLPDQTYDRYIFDVQAMVSYLSNNNQLELVYRDQERNERIPYL